MKKQLLISIAILLFLFTGTTLVILYGRGYRFWFDRGKPDISGTGLLVVRSIPDGAQVFINDHLTTATDSTINLSPGNYTIRIYKEGYSPWEKKINIQKEIVAKAEALLFATAPKLESLTATGIENPTLDPSLTRIAYTVASGAARKNGVYVLDMTTRPLLTLRSASTQIADDTFDTFSKTHLAWSPDGKELLASISAALRSSTTYLLSSTSLNDNPKDVTNTLDTVMTRWETDKTEKENSRLNTLNLLLEKVTRENFSILAWSPDETKILYTASQSATVPIIIKPPLIGTNQTPQQREIKKGAVYVYDTKEDKNFKILDSPLPLSWLPDSTHLIFVHDRKIEIMEYDRTNSTTVYAGPFVDKYVFPFPSGSKVVILTNLGNPDILPNLYTVGLK